MNEAFVLAALFGNERTIAEIAEALEQSEIRRSVSDGSIYMALQRMLDRGFVTSKKVSVISVDGRSREVGRYAITASGQRAARAFFAEAEALVRLRPALGM